MPLEMKLWHVEGDRLEELPASVLDYERRLEAWISQDPSILGLDMAAIGTQIHTGFGRIDVLGITRDGELVIIEIKRDRTSRDVVAQALDYASWINERSYEDLDKLALEHRKQSLAEWFRASFNAAVPAEVSGANHRVVIVAAELDSSSERIVRYLAEKHDLNINAVFFKFFRSEGMELLGRAWLIDPEELEVRTATRHRRPWSGYWFVNVGDSEHRTWVDNRKYNFIGAGHGERYSKPLQKLSKGDRIFAYMKRFGYVGFGEVVTPAMPIDEFVPDGFDRPLSELPLTAPNATDALNDPAMTEWAVGVRWLKAYDAPNAQWGDGLFANQNIVCKLTDERTLDFLFERFGVV